MDLMAPLPIDLEDRFDLVFNHTVLEHAPNPFTGYEQIVKMSNDLVLTVFPFRQELHFIAGNFGDYFRVTPMGLRYLNEINGLTTIFESTTPSPTGSVYIVSLATKRPDKHDRYPLQVPDINKMNHSAGRHSFMGSVAHILATSMRGIARIVERRK